MGEQAPLVVSADTQLLTVKQAAQFLGVAQQTVSQYIWDGKLAAVRVGPRLVRITPQALADFMQAVE
ncbi:helix-turn-helix domain-containing protein [uncultured Mobiluncus sp.]|uniref:helix-turn-helix domain-containing protein n=1 Tax=uncultured Mobiluncus sp. TaxID=293425 RepID=UPI0025F8C513|nr:helix-turn-helix domain-containing protein [uncultured Mobiluncus sp.]